MENSGESCLSEAEVIAEPKWGRGALETMNASSSTPMPCSMEGGGTSVCEEGTCETVSGVLVFGSGVASELMGGAPSPAEGVETPLELETPLGVWGSGAQIESL